MKERFHGIDLHKKYATIMVRDIAGNEIRYISRCKNFQEYIDSLNEKDSVVIEAINNAFYFADLIENQGASCIIVNPYKFKVIKDSWNKTDKRAAADLSIALWMSEMRDEFKMPEVYKPSVEIRELRKLFSQYQLITEQITQYKNSIQAIFVENGIALNKKQTYQLFKTKRDTSILEKIDITDVSRHCILTSLSLLGNLSEQKENIKLTIIKMGTLFEKEIKLCISIKGVSPFMVLAFLADVGDITRFKNVRGYNAYLGVVPTVKSSGGITRMGHITRQSRKLARTLFTQPVYNIACSSDSMFEFYSNIKFRRGAGRSRIAVIRKVFNIMRRMILDGELYRGMEEDNYQKKLQDFNKIINKAA
ncbi:MAG: IS110 family transposase [Deltaproteobacteria bacterium]|nr:IS110 family transposase [Deltaproteobacteria bacterium]